MMGVEGDEQTPARWSGLVYVAWDEDRFSAMSDVSRHRLGGCKDRGKDARIASSMLIPFS